jgi:hypothetical protein
MSGSIGLNGSGWVFLLVAWGGIAAVTAWCFYRLLKSGKL